MFQDAKIKSEVYEKYYELVGLVKQKGAASSKLSKLDTLLTYFNDNYSTFNDEEKKLVKNVVIIANGITEKTNTYYGFVKGKKNGCIKQVKVLNAKRKELK